MRNIVILNSLHFSYPLPILMRVSYNTLIVKQNTSDYYKYSEKDAKTRIRSCVRRIFGAGRLFAWEGAAVRDAVSAAPGRKMYGSNTIAGG